MVFQVFVVLFYLFLIYILGIKEYILNIIGQYCLYILFALISSELTAHKLIHQSNFESVLNDLTLQSDSESFCGGNGLESCSK